jgi:hypothetical protein
MTLNSNPPSEDPSENGMTTPEESFEIPTKEPVTTGQVWNKLLRLGLGEATLRSGTFIATILLVLLVVWVMGSYFLKGQKNTAAEATSTVETIKLTPIIPINSNPVSIAASGFSINRMADFHTNLPAKPRNDIIKYEVVQGDTVFGIAEKFGLQPEWVLWSNKHILGDNPAFIIPGLTLLIPPFQGAVHAWVAGIDGLNGVARGFQVTPDAILDWPGNELDRATIGDFAMPNIPNGKLIFIPYGVGQFTDWLPFFSRDNPAVAQVMGPGFCGTIMDGPIGTGTFIWPTTQQWVSGYDWSPSTNHWGIDIGGKIGNPIYATDQGVVVYAGWNNYGYGNLVVIDHGSGWQSVYAHLDTIAKGCGDYVFQWDIIGTMGSTGNSSGPHLHFELRTANYGKVNPHDFLIQ